MAPPASSATAVKMWSPMWNSLRSTNRRCHSWGRHHVSAATSKIATAPSSAMAETTPTELRRYASELGSENSPRTAATRLARYTSCASAPNTCGISSPTGGLNHPSNHAGSSPRP